MVNDNIYSRLLAGESAEDIAKEFTDALNTAVEQYEEAERKRIEEETAKAKAAREARTAEKRSAMIDLVNRFLYFVGEYYPSFGFTVEDVDAMDDAAIYALADLFIMTLDMEQAMPAKKTFKHAIAQKAETEEPAKRDIFKEAFKMFGL